jgi:hypothetical protein
VTLPVETVTFVVSLLESDTLRFAGAATGKVIGNGTVCPSPRVGFAGTPIGPPLATVIEDDVEGTLGAAVLAVIVADPSVTALTNTLAVVAPDAIVAEAGTVATPGLLERRLIASPPAGAAPERVSVRF